MPLGSLLPARCAIDSERGNADAGQGSGGGATWTKYDHATAIAASLSYMAIQQQDSVGLAIFDQVLSRYFKPSNSPGQWKVVVNELQQVPRWNKTNTGKILDQIAEKLTHRSLIVILSDFFDDLDGIRQGLRHLRYNKHEIMAFQILDPAEIEFPFEDVTLFKGLEEAGETLRIKGQKAAAETVLRDLSDFLTFSDFPQEHWIHLRTTNPIESIFAGVRLRTDVAKRVRNRENAHYLVFKLIERLSLNWRRITGCNLCQLVLSGRQFADGRLMDLEAA